MPKHHATQPVALTIAGSDSGGGAGMQADLKTFASLGVHGTSAITCITAQNPSGVFAIQPCPADIVRQQVEAIFAELPPVAVKTGMLFTPEIVRVAASFFAGKKRPPLIVDPVMIATSGGRLLRPAAAKVMRMELLPRATLVTPNLHEARMLSRRPIDSPEDMRAAAKLLHDRFGCAVLVKGGHLRSWDQAIDIFYDGHTELMLTAPFLRGIPTHGTGCAYSAAITGYLALGCNLPAAVESAKQHVTQTILHRIRVAGHVVLNSFWKG